MREALGDGYTEALRKAYKGKVPDSADLVMYWWYNAAAAVQRGPAERFGFITTNSLKQTFNRRVMQPFLEGDTPPLTLTFAIPDHPWVDAAEGAAVRIAMTVAERTPNVAAPGQLWILKTESVAEGDEAADVTFAEQQGQILSDLSIGAALDSAKVLKSNEGMSSPGVKLHGAGFIVSQDKAKELGLGESLGLENHIRHYLNGQDFTGKSRKAMVIDLFGLNSSEVLTRFPNVYQHVVETVKPERDQNNRAIYRDNWWVFGEARSSFRPALLGLPRYIATVETAKHRVFQFLDAGVLADNKLVTIALDDAYNLGVLSSRFHVVWALAAGSRLGVGNDPVYVKSRCFDPFPFPAATPAQQAHIRELAEQLDAHRKRQQAQHPTLTLTDLYNVVEKLRAGQPLTTKDQTVNQQGLASVVFSLHQQLDAAVADAYAWPAPLPDAEILTRLVRLNHERAQEEAAGHVRYLRPAYQAKSMSNEQLTMNSGLATPAKANPLLIAHSSLLIDFPKELAQQMQAVREVVQQAGTALSVAEAAARFKRLKPEKVEPLLATLAALALLRHTTEGTYAA
ncbi:type IIL restriction-modification enzyme MmeI [Hymenobacter sp. B1770]|uniref:type IIL restriction-modification enzyme MmeI n=1 Tax=Hymenobacter sp. B1770 TaxID=1718788 RepID=UPI003CED65D4